jgi:hypothetical protein
MGERERRRWQELDINYIIASSRWLVQTSNGVHEENLQTGMADICKII